MNLLTFLFFSLSTAVVTLALDYKGQAYQATVQSPNSTTPWYTGGYNSIDVVVIQTLICCPPLPPLRWVLKNSDTSLLSEPFKIANTDTFTAPEVPDISTVRAGKGYVLSIELDEAPYGTFGESEPFEILDGALSPPIIAPSKSEYKPSLTGGEPSHTASPPIATLPGHESDSAGPSASSDAPSLTAFSTSTTPSQTDKSAAPSTSTRTLSSGPSSTSGTPVPAGSAQPSPSSSTGKIVVSCGIAFGIAAAIAAFQAW